jgi:hypothetical protein
MKANRQQAVISDIEAALKLLAFRSYTENVDIFAQVCEGKNRNAMYNNEIDVLLTLDEYRATMMARNALCPGFSTLIENLMTSIDPGVVEAPFWFKEYSTGCGKEVYLYRFPLSLMEYFEYDYSLLVEAIYSHFAMVCLGVCDEDGKDVVLNPTELEIIGGRTSEYTDHDPKAFFVDHPCALVLADSLEKISIMSKFEKLDSYAHEMVEQMHLSEKEFSLEYMKAGQKRWGDLDAMGIAFRTLSYHTIHFY